MTDLKAELRSKLEGSSSRSPVDISVLSAGRHRRRVEIALMEMYQEREVGCCKISKRDKATTHITETTVWWVSCTVTSPDWYGIRGKGPSITLNMEKAKAAGFVKRMPRPPRFNELTKVVLDKVITQPGISRMDLFSHAQSTQFIKDTAKIKSAIGNLTFKKLIISSGTPGNLTYTPGVAK